MQSSFFHPTIHLSQHNTHIRPKTCSHSHFHRPPTLYSTRIQLRRLNLVDLRKTLAPITRLRYSTAYLLQLDTMLFGCVGPGGAGLLFEVYEGLLVLVAVEMGGVSRGWG